MFANALPQRARERWAALQETIGIRKPTDIERFARRAGWILLAGAIAAVLVPTLAVPLAMVGAIVLLACVMLMTPASTNDRESGFFYVGSVPARGEKVWLTADECRSNLLVSGPTEHRLPAMLGLAQNAFDLESGLIFVSGSGDLDVYTRNPLASEAVWQGG
ncbi:hypothetical protein ACVIGB_001070 [Bradyrhizobium sp. USDA 4341]